MAFRHFGNVKKAAIEPDISVGTRVQISLHVLFPFVINSLGPCRCRNIEDEWFAFNHRVQRLPDVVVGPAGVHLAVLPGLDVDRQPAPGHFPAKITATEYLLSRAEDLAPEQPDKDGWRIGLTALATEAGLLPDPDGVGAHVDLDGAGGELDVEPDRGLHGLGDN